MSLDSPVEDGPKIELYAANACAGIAQALEVPTAEDFQDILQMVDELDRLKSQEFNKRAEARGLSGVSGVDWSRVRDEIEASMTDTEMDRITEGRWSKLKILTGGFERDDRSFFEKVIQLSPYDPYIIRRILAVRNKLNNEIPLTQAEAEEVFSVLQMTKFPLNDIRLIGMTLPRLDLSGLVANSLTIRNSTIGDLSMDRMNVKHVDIDRLRLGDDYLPLQLVVADRLFIEGCSGFKVGLSESQIRELYIRGHEAPDGYVDIARARIGRLCLSELSLGSLSLDSACVGAIDIKKTDAKHFSYTEARVGRWDIDDVTMKSMKKSQRR